MEINTISPDNDVGKNGEPASEEKGILQPGSIIKPVVTEEDVAKLAQRLYGIIISEMCELNAYDDRNFLLQADCLMKNPILQTYNSSGYVLKISNTLDSQKEEYFDAQNAMMLHLRKKNIKCPIPVKNIFGKYHSVEKLGEAKHVVRLLEYVPGKMFHDIKHNDNIFYQAGRYISIIDNALKDFRHPAYETKKSLWMLEEVPQLKPFLYVIKDESRRDIVEQVLDAFEKRVAVNLHKFKRGIIHGDFNEHNILVNKKPGKEEYEVSAIIDFGDSSFSYYVFELAIAMTYMMLESGSLETGGLVIAGYNMLRIVPQCEMEVLRVLVASRLCQSLVLGLYTATMDEGNQYILSSQKKGWALLETIWQQNDEDLLGLWNKISEHYLTQSDR